MTSRRTRCGRLPFTVCATALLSILLAGCRAEQRKVLTLSVAASLQDAIMEIESNYQHDHGPVEFRNNFGASGTLAREIEQGAPVDAIISAGTKPVDDLQKEGLLMSGTRTNLLRNSLVLIVPQGSNLASFDDLATGKVRLIAIGDPASVPAGQYARQSLSALKLFDQLNRKLVLGKDVRQVLTYVETDNADAGLVYGTDARMSKKVRVVAVAPESSHDPILYPFAMIAGSRNQRLTREFLVYLTSPTSKAIFMKHGFTMA
jgi:molybdate transport system substrate-binding protein